MNQLDMMTTLVDAARQLPENAILAKAVKAADYRIEVLRQRYERRGYGAHKASYKKISAATAPLCCVCKVPTKQCQCLSGPSVELDLRLVRETDGTFKWED